MKRMYYKNMTRRERQRRNDGNFAGSRSERARRDHYEAITNAFGEAKNFLKNRSARRARAFVRRVLWGTDRATEWQRQRAFVNTIALCLATAKANPWPFETKYQHTLNLIAEIAKVRVLTRTFGKARIRFIYGSDKEYLTRREKIANAIANAIDTAKSVTHHQIATGELRESESEAV